MALSRDTTESDLKQRREIIKGTAHYIDQSAVLHNPFRILQKYYYKFNKITLQVLAASKGRVLVLEGIEKAERNVLPVLNNLLENREVCYDSKF